MNKYLKAAIEASRRSTYRHKLGAVIVKKNKIVSVGYNKPHKTHPRSNTPFRTIHCELDAILRCSEEDLQGSTIYVLREGAAGFNLAKPCPCCMELIRMAGISTVVFSTPDGMETLSVA